MFGPIFSVLGEIVSTHQQRVYMDADLRYRVSLRTWYKCGPWKWRVIRNMDGSTEVQHKKRGQKP